MIKIQDLNKCDPHQIKIWGTDYQLDMHNTKTRRETSQGAGHLSLSTVDICVQMLGWVPHPEDP